MNAIKKIFRPIILVGGLVIIAISFGIAVVFLDNDISIAIITAGSTVFVSVFAAIWARDIEKSKIIEQQIREKKTPVYEELIRIAFEVLFASKEQNSPEEQRQGKNRNRKEEVNETAIARLQKLTPELVIWGTDEVVNSWVQFRNATAIHKDKPDPSSVMFAFEEVMSAIRRDLGHENTILKKGDLLKIFVNNL